LRFSIAIFHLKLIFLLRITYSEKNVKTASEKNVKTASEKNVKTASEKNVKTAFT